MHASWFRRWLLFALLPSVLAAESPAPTLPPPQRAGGQPLLTAMAARRTTREFKADALPPQVLSDLLWAAWGVNRADSGGRTAPSAMNSQELDVYVATADGLFLYVAAGHELKPVGTRDVRLLTTGQEFGRVAPVTLIFVADYARMTKAKPEQREFYAAMDTGFVSQNVYLFCASAGLGTVVHDLDRGPLAAAMGLRPDQHIMLAQAVGFPK